MLEAGQAIDQYVLNERLGEGATAAVWRAHRDGEHGDVAIKFLKEADSPELRQRFEREAQFLERLDHPGCVKYLGFGVDQDRPYIVTEYVQGDELNVWQQREPDLDDLLEVVRQIAEALAAAHTVGLVHRDLKPTNILVHETPRSLDVKVLDFGIARMAGRQTDDITKTGQVVGTAGYMSPEQLRGEPLSQASDLYSLGAVVFEMLEKRPVFKGPTPLETGMMHLHRNPPRISGDYPKRLSRLVERLLRKEATARPPNADYVLGKLQEIRDSGSTTVVDLVVERARGLPPGTFLTLALLATMLGFVLTATIARLVE